MIYKDNKTGREIEVFTEYAKGEDYTGVEVTRNGQWEAEIGCWFEGKTLMDYDGVYSLSPDVARALRAAGWSVPHDMIG